MLRFVLVLIGSGLGLTFLLLPFFDRVSSFWIGTLSVMAVSFIVIFSFLRQTILHRRDSFTRNYLLTIVLKMLLLGIFIFLVLKFDPKNLFFNAVFFLTTYFVFTGIELLFLYKELRRPALKNR